MKAGHDKPESGGAWFQKSAISYIEIPFEHQLGQLNDGWRLTALSTGRLTVHLAAGHAETFNLVAGDLLASTGQELYLSYGSREPGAYESEQDTPEQVEQREGADRVAD